MIKISAPAKLNLALDILGRRSDGYHEVDMVMQTIALADQLTLAPATEIELTCSNPVIPLGPKNLVWKTVKLVQETFGIRKGIKVHIEKEIPVAAGLAGGSADAAATLHGLNELWKLQLSITELQQLGAKIGADVPFCVCRGTARACGIGEQLTEVASKLDLQLLLITPAVPVSTAWAYSQVEAIKFKKRPQVDRVVTALGNGDLETLTTAWGNVFEEIVLPAFPEVAKLKQLMVQFGLQACLMSGSGPSVFALNPDQKAVRALREVIPADWFLCLTNFQNGKRIDGDE